MEKSCGRATQPTGNLPPKVLFLGLRLTLPMFLPQPGPPVPSQPWAGLPFVPKGLFRGLKY